jgi:phosphonopyruvate decarboxylase
MTLRADAFLEPAVKRGFAFYAGVPCSFLSPLINRVMDHPAARYIGAANEGDALAIAAGAWLGGRQGAIMLQNSGLGNALNPLTSLNFPFRIPALLIITWRGQPGLRDEPQHELMGEITLPLLDTMHIRHRPFPQLEAEVDGVLAEADEEMERSQLPFAFIVTKDSLRPEPLLAREAVPRRIGPIGPWHDFREADRPPARAAVLDRLLHIVPENAAIVATTGKCSRELFTLADRPQHLYQIGSMGCAGAMALGIALHTPLPVIVLDGDGAVLMRMGILATAGAYAPPNFVHILLDNGVHDSTGGQATVSATVDFARVAIACGYATGTVCDSLAGFAHAFGEALSSPGPHFIHACIAPGSMDALGRPTLAPADVARRFRDFVTRSARA